MTFAETLVKLDACGEARAWVGSRDLATAHAECERGDWLMWFVVKAGVDRVLVVDAACDCAALAAATVKDKPLREAIENLLAATRRYARGEVEWPAVDDARRAMWRAYADADAAADAACAAAAYAAYAADAYAADDAAYVVAARVGGHAVVCDAIRARISVEVVAAALKAKEAGRG